MSSETFEAKFKALQQRFIDGIPADVQEMVAALEHLAIADKQKGGLQKLIYLSHRYHGNGRTFGYPLISAAAKELESALRDMASSSEMPATLQEIEILFNKLQAILLPHYLHKPHQ